jgi:hypothetical protein
MTFIRQSACLRSGMTACGNARYVAAHCRGVIILISRSPYSLPAYFYTDNYSARRQRKTGVETPRHKKREALSDLPFTCLEREKSLELSTSTLARLRSTN